MLALLAFWLRNQSGRAAASDDDDALSFSAVRAGLPTQFGIFLISFTIQPALPNLSSLALSSATAAELVLLALRIFSHLSHHHT